MTRGNACLIPVDEPARQVTAPTEEEIKRLTIYEVCQKKKHMQAS